METKIEKLINALGCSRAEAIDIIESDRKIDNGEKLFELSAEQEKASKQARQADRTPTVYKLDNTAGKRSKKADNDKQEIVGRLTSTLENWFKSNSQCTYNACTNLEIINPEREFTFTYNGKKYKVVLSAPRS